MAEDTSKSPSSSSSTATATTNPTTNARGIPHFPFLPNATDYVKSTDDVGPTLDRFQEMIQKYTFMQQNVEKRLLGLKEKVPEMRSSLETVRFLIRKRKNATQAKEEEVDQLGEEDDDNDDDEKDELKGTSDTLQTTFPLADTLHAHATLRPAAIDDVYLWLGANVMVSYPLLEAQELLESKLSKAKEGITACDEDLEFLRVQITTLEVATARVYNWDVGERRKKGVTGGKSGGKGEEEEE